MMSGGPTGDPHGGFARPLGDPAAGSPGTIADAGSLPTDFFATPFSIGSVTIPNRVVLAPMAGLTCSSYRRRLKAHGAGLVVTEMVSAYGLIHGNRRTTEDYLSFEPEERPIAAQLFGDTPEAMAQAARLVLEGQSAAAGRSGRAVFPSARPDMLDINMGCPVRKVCRTGAGSALLASPERAVAVAKAVVQVAAEHGVPVTVKLRSGLREGERTALDLAPRLEEVGVAALGVHPRATSQHYSGVADHSVTEAVVRAVSIPVIASGDVVSVRSARAMVNATGAAAIMVARGATGNPWLVDGLIAGEDRHRPPLPEVVAELRALLALVIVEMGDERAMKWIYRLVGWYLRPSRVPVPTVEALRAAPDCRALDEGLARLAAGEFEPEEEVLL
jgi:tRNA-dihydrouridine synthase B